MPFFSVVIPTFNREKFLQKAVDSVLAQSFDNFELIVIDDGSEDGTEAMIRRLPDQRLRYFFQKNRGVSHARNRGLKEARAEWIAFLDSDDWWTDDKLQKVAQHIKQFPDTKIFHTEERWYRRGKIHNPKTKHAKPDGYVYQYALPLCCISISTAVVHRDVFKRVGTFDENLPACEDYDFWLRATHKFPVKLIPEYLTLKDGGRPDQLSSQWGLDRWRIQALVKMLSSNTLTQADHHATRAVLKQKIAVYINGALKRGKHRDIHYYQGLADKYLSGVDAGY